MGMCGQRLTPAAAAAVKSEQPGPLKSCARWASGGREEFARCESRVCERREQIREVTAAMEARSSNGGPSSAPSTGSIVSQSTGGGGTMRSAQKRQFYVKAHFDYDPLKDSDLPGHGLAFLRNDILHVTNAADDDWWQAKKVDPGTGEEDELGIIPSKKRVERKERSRARKVNFGKVDYKHVGNPDRRKKKRFALFGKDKKDAQSEDETDAEQPDEFLTYEIVTQRSIDYTRPIVILGLMKDRLNEDLIQDDPDHFGICVAHTTRPKRENEVEGKEYHFAQKREQMEMDIQNRLFIEAGQYNGNLYGTSVAAVRKLAEEGKHCVLDVSQYAIRRLQLAGLYPIAILSKPKSVENIQELNKRITAEQAEKLMEKTSKLERDLAKYFTGMAEGDTYSELLENVKSVIEHNSGSFLWIPSGESI